MALSLPGERSVAAGSQVTPVQGFFAWIAQVKANRARRTALKSLLDLDPARLKDLGIDRSDIADAMASGNGRTPGMVLSAARARNARS